MPAPRAVPRLLLITGAPASGKTRLARDLGTRYGGGLCSKDEIKETLFAVLGTGDAARAADPGRHRGHGDRHIEVGTGDGATFLDLPGPRLRFNSEADWHSELATFCDELDRWYSPPKV